MGMSEIEFGSFRFDNSTIYSGSIRIAQDPLGVSLEVNTLTAEVLCGDPSITNFKLNTPIRLFYDGNLLGVFYAQEVSRKNAIKYKISGISAIGLLDNITHYGGIYTGQTVSEVLPDLFGSVKYSVKTSIARTKLYGHLPVDTSRANLIQILVASGATVKTDLDGVVRIEDLYSGVSRILPPDKVFIKSSVSYESPVTDVIVVEHQFIKDPATEERTLFEGTASDGDIIVFSNPAYDLVTEGGTIKRSGANYAEVSGGSLVVKGKEYTHIEREVMQHIQDSEVKSTKRVDSATLVSLVNSGAVAKRLANYYRQNQVLEMDFVHEKQSAGDVIETVNPYDYTPTQAFAETMELFLGGYLYGESNMRVGYRPERVEDIGILQERIVLTGSGTFTIPEGVEELTAVLIDGGEEGSPGEDGESTTYNSGSSSYQIGPTATITQNNPTATTSATSSSSTEDAGQVGAGGKGGKGGKPGRVYRATISVTPGNKINYSCGLAIAIGAEATVTIFGELSSVSGSSSDSGYTDPVTNERYAYKGTDGEDGAEGGSAGLDGGGTKLSVGGKGFEGGSSKYIDGEQELIGLQFFRNIYIEAPYTIGPAGGGGAGGSSGTVPGSPGGEAGLKGQPAVHTIAMDNFRGRCWVSIAYGGDGGNGADAQPAVSYGCGGDGGGGAGGGGQNGRSNISVTHKIELIKYANTVPDDWSASASSRAESAVFSHAKAPGAGGKGGKGAQGKEGCIILYLSKKQVSAIGPVKEKTGRILIDRLGRKVIV